MSGGFAQQFCGVGNEVFVAHLPMGAGRSVISDPHPSGNPGCGDRGVGEERGNPVLLVSDERVHRIQDERLDPALPAVPGPHRMVDGGDQEGFGLSRPGASRDQRRLRFLASTRKSLPGGDLVGIRTEPGGVQATPRSASSGASTKGRRTRR